MLTVGGRGRATELRESIQVRNGSIIEQKGDVGIIKGILFLNFEITGEEVREAAKQTKFYREGIRLNCHKFLGKEQWYDHTRKKEDC